jgi:hypothetical protein
VVKMATVREGYITEEQRSVVRFLVGKRIQWHKILINKCFLFTVRSVCRVKRFTTTLRNSLRDFRT